MAAGGCWCCTCPAEQYRSSPHMDHADGDGDGDGDPCSDPLTPPEDCRSLGAGGHEVRASEARSLNSSGLLRAGLLLSVCRVATVQCSESGEEMRGEWRRSARPDQTMTRGRGRAPRLRGCHGGGHRAPATPGGQKHGGAGRCPLQGCPLVGCY